MEYQVLKRTEQADRATCPECGGAVVLVTDGLVGKLIAPAFLVRGKERPRWRMVPAPFGACMSCEFCIEVGQTIRF